MKCDSSSSDENSMTAEPCSCKIRFLALVINTADVINEATTPKFGIFHAMSAPAAIMTTYFFISSLLLGTCVNRNATHLLQVYGLVACCSVHCTLCVAVFQELKAYKVSSEHAILVLNGVLPLLIICLLLSDLIVTLFSCRSGQSLELPQVSPVTSHSQVPVHMV